MRFMKSVCSFVAIKVSLSNHVESGAGRFGLVFPNTTWIRLPGPKHAAFL